MSFMFNLDEYTTVKERIKLFWEKYPDGAIFTEILDWSDTRFITKTSLYRLWTDERPFATGHAKEEVAERGVNRDFALENCETSSVGVAMKNANIGTDKHGPSREEMIKVTKLQMSKPKEYVPVEKEDDPWTIKHVPAPTTSAEAVAVVKDIIGGTTDKDIPNCACGKPRILRTGTAKTGKQWAAWDCGYKASNYQVGQKKPCEPDRIWLELNANGQWQPQKARG
jgi:hypothetical protein